MTMTSAKFFGYWTPLTKIWTELWYLIHATSLNVVQFWFHELFHEDFHDIFTSTELSTRALPVGTGATIGVAGYVLNGGLSGYFGRRLGLLGQRVARLTLDAAGAVRHFSPESDGGELFRSVLGTGAALGVVTSLTFRTAPGDAVRTGGQFVVPFGDEGPSTEDVQEISLIDPIPPMSAFGFDIHATILKGWSICSWIKSVWLMIGFGNHGLYCVFFGLRR